MKQSFPEKCGRIQAGVLAVLSMFLIWLPTLDSFLHLDKTPVPNENRALGGFPEFQSGLEGFHKYITDFEQYYNDRFGFRNRLIRWQHKWKHGIFRDVPLSDNAIVGKNGWLFFSGADMIDTIRGINRFTSGDLKAWQTLLEGRRDWCVRHGCAYIFVIPPDKQSIYPEFLPDWLLPVKTPTKLDQFMAYMKANSTVPILDLRPALLEAKSNAPLYLLTDTHWNSLGAFAGYQSLIKKLSEQLPGLKPLPLDAFERKIVPERGQDLARNLGQEESMPETANVVFTPLPPLKSLPVTIDTGLRLKVVINNLSPRLTVNPEAKGKVILFHDSYSNAWQPILGYNFNKIIYTWQPNWDMDLLEREKPDVVIDEFLERHVISADPTRTLRWKD